MEHIILEGAKRNKYQLFTNGEIIALGRVGARGYTVKDKKLKPCIRNGYLSYSLNLEGKTKYYYLHRLIAQNFIPNPDNLPCVNHKDGDKLNNNIDNLEWCSYSQNNKHAFEHNLKQPTILKHEKHWNAKLTEEDVEWIRQHYIKNSCEYGQGALARKFNTSRPNIYDIINYNTWK